MLHCYHEGKGFKPGLSIGWVIGPVIGLRVGRHLWATRFSLVTNSFHGYSVQ